MTKKKFHGSRKRKEFKAQGEQRAGTSGSEPEREERPSEHQPSVPARFCYEATPFQASSLVLDRSRSFSAFSALSS
jgi:hypothetical protein